MADKHQRHKLEKIRWTHNMRARPSGMLATESVCRQLGHYMHQLSCRATYLDVARVG